MYYNNIYIYIRPSKKKRNEVSRSRLHYFLGPILFFFYLLLEKLKQTKIITFNTSYPIFLRNRHYLS